jgi:putative oxidoreductase
VVQYSYLIDLFQSGMGSHAGYGALLANRIFLGLFFAISGFHKLFNKERHTTLIATLRGDRIPLIVVNQWWVPAVEFAGGLALVTGIFAPLAAAALTIECLVAVATDGWKRIASYQPIDTADWLDDLLYQPEMLAMVALLIVITLGPGPFTLPNFLSWT